MARKKSQYEVIAEGILRKKGQDPKKWLSSKLREKKMAILEGDKDWEQQTAEILYQEFVLKELEKEYPTPKKVSQPRKEEQKENGGNNQ